MVEFILEFCNHCGKDVSYSSGLFVNRVPDLNDILTRMENGSNFPIGDFVCRNCDLNTINNDVNEELNF